MFYTDQRHAIIQINPPTLYTSTKVIRVIDHYPFLRLYIIVKTMTHRKSCLFFVVLSFCRATLLELVINGFISL